MAFASGSYIKSPKEAWTCPTVNKTLPLCLCVISLLLGVLAEVTFLSSGARAQVDGIIVAGADDVSIITDEYSAELANSTSEVTSRVAAEYGDFSSQLGLNKSGELDQAAKAVSSNVAVEYADFAFNYQSQDSDAIRQAVGNVASRIVVEYADYVTALTQSPYLGPQPYPDDTNPPSIVVTRKPPGHEVNDSQNVFVSADITDAESGVRNATLQYTTDNSTDWYGASAHVVPMSLNLTLRPHNSLALPFNTTIPGQSSGTRVRFRVVAYDFAGNNATIDGVIDATTYLVVPEFPSFLILLLFMMATLLAVMAYKRKFQTRSEYGRVHKTPKEQMNASHEANRRGCVDCRAREKREMLVLPIDVL